MTNDLDHSIIKPSFTLWDPCTPENYMEFLEKCTRVCYKSEHLTKKDSAKKLLNKVVKQKGHLSVTEHATCIIEFKYPLQTAGWFLVNLFEKVPLFAGKVTFKKTTIDEVSILISGNVRMWQELIEKNFFIKTIIRNIDRGILYTLGNIWPFFFEKQPQTWESSLVKLIDNNPSTNKDNLTKEELMKHVSLTGLFIGTRSMSHQLVRHRLCAFSQESQRFCNYGKKGFQFITPPSFMSNDEMQCPTPRDRLVTNCIINYREYKRFLDLGIPPEDARSILPNACKTEVVVTSTLENWKHMFNMRGHNEHAQWEIKELFLEAEKQINSFIGWEV